MHSLIFYHREHRDVTEKLFNKILKLIWKNIMKISKMRMVKINVPEKIKDEDISYKHLYENIENF